MEGTRTEGLMNIGHRGEAAVYAAKALEPATAPCEASRQKLTDENDELRECVTWCLGRIAEGCRLY
jgi:hypothetical protein